jgi:hypothetical protein
MRPNADLYKQDFFAWTHTTAALIRAGKWYDIAPEPLAEEVESLGARDQRELRRRLQRLVTHLLKWQYQPSARQTGTVGESRSARNGRRSLISSGKVLPCGAPSLRPLASAMRWPANTPAPTHVCHSPPSRRPVRGGLNRCLTTTSGRRERPAEVRTSEVEAGLPLHSACSVCVYCRGKTSYTD